MNNETLKCKDCGITLESSTELELKTKSCPKCIEKSQDEMGRILYNPAMPGKSLTQGLPYYVDLLMALRVERDADGNAHRALLTDSDGLWQAKDRSGKLAQWEAPDLGEIIAKIGGASC